MIEALGQSLLFGNAFENPWVWIRPLGYVAVGAGAALAAIGVIVVLLRFAAPAVSAVAWTTAKESLSQPFFYVVTAIGLVALPLFVLLPYNTLGEDVKMIKLTGLPLIMILSIIVAVWTASTSVAEEIEGRVALTVLAKPIRRVEFIFGKFLGVLFPVALMFIILGALFLSTISFAVVYDARERAMDPPQWQDCLAELAQVAPGLPLAFMETVVMAAIALAVSTRLPLVPNLVICTAIYAIGHLLPTLVHSTAGQFEIARFFAQLTATILPILDVFNIDTAIALNNPVPLSYLAWAAVYCVLYTGVAMLVALLLFEDRDLA